MNEATQNVLVPFSAQEFLAFQTLRTRYEEDHDHFTEQERARLQFVRWLCQEGRLDCSPDGEGFGQTDHSVPVEGPTREGGEQE